MNLERTPKVLALDDDSTWLEQIPLIFENSGYDVHAYSNIDQGLIAIENTFYDVVLLDMNFVGDKRTGLDVFRRIAAKDSEVSVIVISGETDPKRIIEIANAGITQFIPKPASIDEIRNSVNEAIRKKQIRRESILLTAKTSNILIGSSQAMVKLKADILQAANAGVKDILILGESGTGKEAIARSIAELADPSKRFYSYNCGGLNDNLIESELFGHVKGAYTGADRERAGAFELAQGGFVFLDEIGEMPLHQQVKLLRVIQERKVQRVGSNDERSVSFKSISATNVDIEKSIAAKNFREDLYYRIAKFVIKVPSLRERLDDVPDLVHFFLTVKHKNKYDMTPQAVQLLCSYHWPGNVRQLESVIDMMIARAENRFLREKDICNAIPELAKMFTPKQAIKLFGKSGYSAVSQERAKFLKAIADAGGNKEKAATILNMSRATFYRRASGLGIINRRENVSIG